MIIEKYISEFIYCPSSYNSYILCNKCNQKTDHLINKLNPANTGINVTNTNKAIVRSSTLSKRVEVEEEGVPIKIPPIIKVHTKEISNKIHIISKSHKINQIQ